MSVYGLLVHDGHVGQTGIGPCPPCAPTRLARPFGCIVPPMNSLGLDAREEAVDLLSSACDKVHTQIPSAVLLSSE